MYKLYCTQIGGTTPNAATTVGVNPQVSFVFDLANTDYQAYLKWLDEGGIVLPADE